MVLTRGLACLLLLASCGEHRPRPDLVKPSVIVPTPDSLHVGVLERVTVDYTGPLQPELVTAEHVRLLAPDAKVALPASYAYDVDAHRITLTPAAPLAYGARYRLRITGLVSAYGEPVDDVSVAFTTIFNSTTAERYFDTSSNRFVMVTTYSLDTDGRLSRAVLWGAGADSVLGTADDDQSSCSTYAYDEAGTTRMTSYSPGVDASCSTVDDVVLGYRVLDASVLGRHRETAVYSPGADGFWMTSDDIPDRLTQADMDDRGRMSRAVSYSGFGGDERSFTEDDPVDGWREVTWNGNAARTVWFAGPGWDGIWLTADDDWGYVSDLTTDDLGRTLVETVYSGSGADGRWRTADDEMMYRYVSRYTDLGLYDAGTAYSAPGTDGVWDTADDVMAGYIVERHDAAGARLSSRRYDCGPNAVCSDADDRMLSEQFFEPSL